MTYRKIQRNLKGGWVYYYPTPSFCVLKKSQNSKAMSKFIDASASEPKKKRKAVDDSPDAKVLRQSRNFCFTMHNYDPVYGIEYPPEIGYIVYQKEACPKTGKLHLQGYVEFNKPMTWKMVIAMGGAWAHMHLEQRMGNQEEARDYCMKEDTRVPGTEPIEWGVMAKSGQKRTMVEDMEKLRKLISNGATYESLTWMEPMLAKCYNSIIKGMLTYHASIQSRELCPWVVYIYGGTGLGKSFPVRELEKDSLWEPKLGDGSGWLEGYTGQDAILFDEFRGQIKFSDLIQYLDPGYSAFPQRGQKPVKNIAKRIYFSSPIPLEEQYQNVKEDHMQLYRRVHYEWQVPDPRIPGMIKSLQTTKNVKVPTLNLEDVVAVPLPPIKDWSNAKRYFGTSPSKRSRLFSGDEIPPGNPNTWVPPAPKLTRQVACYEGIVDAFTDTRQQ